MFFKFTRKCLSATWIRLVPLLILYVAVFAATVSSSLVGDEPRYVDFARNLARGFYSDRDHVNLWNGPGYPLVLLPFSIFGLPWTAAKALNVLFLFGAVCYLRAILQLYIRRDVALGVSCLFGMSPPFMATVHLLVTESLASFLVCGFAFHYCTSIRSRPVRPGSIAVASAYLGWLLLTKVIFGYVLAFLLLLHLLMFVVIKKGACGRVLAVYGLALLFCLPYLAYTYSLTGRAFYWANSGGLSLYWMSSPYAGELGDWHGTVDEIRGGVPLSRQHHEFFDSLRSLPSVEQDDALRKRGIDQITGHPRKFILNWAANVGRLLFSYPFSFVPQKLSTYFYIVPNMFIVVLGLLSLYPSVRWRKAIPPEIWMLLLFLAVSFGASSLVSAYERQFQVLVPIAVVWISYTLHRFVRVSVS